MRSHRAACVTLEFCEIKLQPTMLERLDKGINYAQQGKPIKSEHFENNFYSNYFP